MSRFTDYINSLEGKQDIDPVVVAATLMELHNEEIGTAEAKIAKLETDLNDGTTAIAERDNSIRDLKAKNWDLVNSIPVDDSNNNGGPAPKEKGEIDPGTVTIDDVIFKEQD